MKAYLIVILSLLISLPTLSQAQNWEKIGEKTVGKGKEVINCSHKGKFRTLKIQVENAPVEFESINVEFLNGGEQNFSVRQFIYKGGQSRPMDLIGNKRTIKRIELICSPKETKKGGKKEKPKVIVYGKT